MVEQNTGKNLESSSGSGDTIGRDTTSGDAQKLHLALVGDSYPSSATKVAEENNRKDSQSKTPEKGDGQKEAGHELPLPSLKLESPVARSINGQERYLDLDPAKLQKVNLAVDKNGPAKALDPSPADLKDIVGAEKEQKFRHAFNLVSQYEHRVDKEVLRPGLQKFAGSLDNAERAMPKAKLESLELERANYGASMAVQAMARVSQDSGSLVYYPPPERGKEMNAFDITAMNLRDQIGKSVVHQIDKIGKSYGPKLDQAGALIEEYYRLKEEKQPKPAVQTPMSEA